MRRVFTSSEIEDLLASGSSATLALLPEGVGARRLAETLAAMANAQGGVALIGVDAQARLTGLVEPKAARDQALEAALQAEPPLLLPLPELVEMGERLICAQRVPPGLPHVYQIRGQYLTRSGAQNRVLSTAELRSLLLARSETSLESTVPQGASVSDLDDARIERYLSAMPDLATGSPEQALLARGCAVEQEGNFLPTLAGLLLFGRQPERFMRSSEIIAVRYSGETMSDEFMREDIRGPLPDQIRRAEAFVNANMRRGMRLGALERKEVTEYPPSVVREAIVNAVGHRDYSIRGEGIRILMFADRLEVYSPGRLAGHVTLDNLLNERYSRNEVIVQVLSDLGFIERLGYGIDRMIAAMTDAGLPVPVFQETAAGFRVVLHNQGAALLQAATQPQAWAAQGVNPRQQLALSYLAGHDRITNREYQELCPGVSDETLRRDLADLVERSLLLKIGEKRATYYILK